MTARNEHVARALAFAKLGQLAMTTAANLRALGRWSQWLADADKPLHLTTTAMKRSDLAEELADVLAALDPFLASTPDRRMKEKEERDRRSQQIREWSAGLDLNDRGDMATYQARVEAAQAEEQRQKIRRKNGHPPNVTYLDMHR